MIQNVGVGVAILYRLVKDLSNQMIFNRSKNLSKVRE